MAALTRATEATYTVHERINVHTSDREDHSFCGVMFPLECKALVPIDRIVITSISVRGRLGPLTLWTSNLPDDDDGGDGDDGDGDDDRRRNRKYIIAADQKRWTKIYSKYHRPSFSEYDKLDVSDSPIVLRPGQVRGVYVHSSLPGDEAIVYDDYRGHHRGGGGGGADGGRRSWEVPEDDFVAVRPGMAHVSETPFGHVPVWGWGPAWRHDRRFVGRLEYGVVYKLWSPRTHPSFGTRFQRLVATLLACQRRQESPVSALPDECLYYVLHMCRWDYAGDDATSLREAQTRRERRRRERRRPPPRRGVAERTRRTIAAAARDDDNDDRREDANAELEEEEDHDDDLVLYDNEHDDLGAGTGGWRNLLFNHDFFSAVFTATLVMVVIRNMEGSVDLVRNIESFFRRS